MNLIFLFFQLRCGDLRSCVCAPSLHFGKLIFRGSYFPIMIYTNSIFGIHVKCVAYDPYMTLLTRLNRLSAGYWRESSNVPGNGHSGRYICPNNCGRTYSSEASFKFHFKYECGKEKNYKCAICGRLFLRKTNLKVHTVNVHGIVQLRAGLYAL